MRKFLLLPVLAAIAGFSNAQAPVQPGIIRSAWIEQSMREERPVVVLPAQSNNVAPRVQSNSNPRTKSAGTLKSLLDGTPLNSQKIGSAGNLLTITNFGCNQLCGYSSGPLSIVSFVHRTDETVNTNGNIAQYSLDFSINGGQTWNSNIGPFTVATNPPIDNNGTDPHGRFPLGGIFNPAGNTNPDSTYEVYSGTWHDAPVNATTGSWVGQMRGRGQFTGTTSTFDVHVDTINGGITDVATGFVQGAPGVFWAVNEDYTGTFATTSNAITRGVIVEKGVWNAATRDFVWTAQELPQQFDSFAAAATVGTITASAAESFDIAFDPTGQYGWISCLGDITNGPTDSTLHPIFWYSTDSGTTWSQAYQIPLDSLPGVVGMLNTTNIYAGGLAATSGIPTTSFEAKLSVDYLGNPHLLCTVGNAPPVGDGGYSIASGAGYTMYDITQNPVNSCTPTWNNWAAVFIDSVQTLRGNTTADNPAYTEDNRPLISRTADGKKMFFFWSASDASFNSGSGAIGDDNEYPNLFARGFDLEHSTSTPSVNLTQGDSKWGGPTTLYPAGGNIQGDQTFQGAFYSTVSPIAMPNGNTGYNIPLVLTQIDYEDNEQLSTNPAQFWYINNINFSQFDFTNGVSATLTPIGPDTVYVVINHSYTDQGATIQYGDTACTHSGLLHVVTNSSGVIDSVPGTYFVNYAAEDLSGNIYATANRVVIVVSAPVANFSYHVLAGLHVQFNDMSLYNPTVWAWTFGDGGTDNIANPIYAYSAPGSYQVCLTDSNAYGTSAPYCQTVVVTALGINEVDFASNINMFPNPTSGKVSITLGGNATPDFTVNVVNVLGSQVIAPSEYKAGTTNVELNVSSLSDGVYLVKIHSSIGESVKRLVVAHK